MPDVRPLCGGLRAPLEQAGIVSRVEAARVLEVLRDDITWIAEAASPEQRAQLDGDGAPDSARRCLGRDA